MVKLQRILVPTDYSECSRAALERAFQLAEAVGAEIELVHVWAAPFFGPQYHRVTADREGKSLFALMREQAEAEMKGFLATVDPPGGVRFSARIESGEPVQRILELSQEGEHDLIVTGTHGRTGPQRWVLGSVAERLVQLSRCPVLTVPQGRS